MTDIIKTLFNEAFKVTTKSNDTIQWHILIAHATVYCLEK